MLLTPRLGDAADEFQSILGRSNNSVTVTPTRHDQPTNKTQLSDQQLYERIEEQLEQLDKKRLQLQQLVRSWHDAPYSSRVARSVESTRLDSARLAKKIHHLFKFIPQTQINSNTHAAASSSSSSSAASGALDPVVAAKFAPLFQNYAAVSRILNIACLESVQFEKSLETNKAKGGAQGSPPGSGRSRVGIGGDSLSSRRAARTGTPTGSSNSNSDSEADPSTGSQSIQQLDESLPLLQVNGLDSYEEMKRGSEYMNISSMVLDIATSFRALQSITAQQQEFIDASESNIQAAKEKSEKAELELRKASRYKAFGLVMAGGVTGAAIGGPLGALVGLKTGLSVGVGIGLMGAGGALIGAAAGKQLQKARFVPLTHLEEEAEMQSMKEKENKEKEQKIKEQEAAAASSSSSSSSSAANPTSNSNSPNRKCISRKCL